MTDWQKLVDEFNGRWDMCFGCGEKNPIGLKLNFKWTGKAAVAEHIPRAEFQGWPGILHGGIIANIIDEAASWAFNFNGMYVVTAKMELLFHSPAKIGVPIIITSEVTTKTSRRGEAHTEITQEGTLIAEGNSLHVSIKNHRKIPLIHDWVFIWDMDGVIVDTAEQHFESWRYALHKHGIDFTDTDFKRVFGLRNDTIIRDMMRREVSPGEIEEIAGEKEEYFREIAKDNVRPLPGAVELIKSMAQLGFKMAVATSAPPENVELLLGTLGIKDCFQQFAYGREVTEGKPSPQLYLLAAQRLGKPPEDCIVVEDAVAGIAGAKRGGMHAIAVTNTSTRELFGEADLVVENLGELNISIVEKMMQKKE